MAHVFSEDELIEHGVRKSDITEDLLSRLDKEWNDFVDLIRRIDGSEAADRAAETPHYRNHFLWGALL